jgi:hypothetical protein
LASLVIELTGSRSRIVHRRKMTHGNDGLTFPDANDVLSWAPKTELVEGLSRTVAYS